MCLAPLFLIKSTDNDGKFLIPYFITFHELLYDACCIAESDAYAYLIVYFLLCLILAS